MLALGPAQAEPPAAADRGEPARTARVDAARIAAADGEPEAWLSYGRTYDEQRYSPLDLIDTSNVGRLGLAFSYATKTRRGMEATPLVVDGTIYTTGSWSRVYAIDAVTGEERWTYDPNVPRWKGRDACCDVVNRGAALWKGRVYIGTIDGRLVALDAKTGALDWEVQTVDPTAAYTITGAPRVVKGRVVIGNGGAEYWACAATSPRLRRRDGRAGCGAPSPYPASTPQPAVRAARGDRAGGGDLVEGLGLVGARACGGTVWDAFAYDPELDLLYAGRRQRQRRTTGRQRSPGGGDNLFLASILALDPDTGELVWHYQTTPARTGTTRRPSTSCSRISRSAAARARC